MGIRMPQESVLDTLFRKFLEVKEKTSSLAGELGDRVKAQYDNGNLDPFFWKTYSALRKKGHDNEIRGLEMCEQGIAACEMAAKHIRARGHVSDLVKDAQAAEAKDGNVLPLDQAKAAFERTKHKAPTPAEVDEKAAQKAKRGRKPKAAEAEAAPAAAANDETEEDLRPRHLQEADKQRAAEADGELPPVPERRKKGPPPPADPGTYRIQ